MSATVEEDPGSPPGLTASKSSKSSTNPSSTTSGDGIISDVTNFEDIGLKEEVKLPPKKHYGLGIERLNTPRATTVPFNMDSHRSNEQASAPMRDLTNQTHRPSCPPNVGSVKGLVPQQSLSLPNGMPLRKISRNASSPSLAIRAMSNYNRSRSPSPHTSPPLQGPFPNPKPARRPSSSSSAQTPSVPVRRGSWQPSRKSVKELEAECDEEEGEDLPEEASLWNVPLSPRPPEERNVSLSPVLSPRLSPGGSPERPSPLRTSVGADGTQHTASKPVPSPTGRRTLPANFQSPPAPPGRFTRRSSAGPVPSRPQYQRIKSWNIALSELSEEAKALTKSLENHAKEREQTHDFAIQRGERSNTEKLHRAKTAPMIELPPLRANNIMIDPLPISKEKEKVLSRTRPSWLPPKDKSEEKKHLREYQKLMELSREAEKRKASKSADSQCAKDDMKVNLLRLWEEHVLPNWDQAIRDPRTREIWWRGVAPKSRAQVWSKAIGNELALTDTTFQRALQRAQRIEADLRRNPSSSDLHRRERSWLDAIKRDVQLTIPSLKIFQPGAPMHNSLIDVLKAYAFYRSDVGYSHGTHLIAAFLHLTMPTPSQTFICLANLLNRPLPLAFLTGDPAGEQKAYTYTLGLLKKKFPRLHDHLFGPVPTADPSASTASLSPTTTASLNFKPQTILEPMFRTLFLGPGEGLGLETAARVWDVMVFDGDMALFRAAVATLGTLEGKLYGGREDVLSVLGWRGDLGNLGDEDAFMARVREAGKVNKEKRGGKRT